MLAEAPLSKSANDKPLYLRVEAKGSQYQFYYSLTPGNYTAIGSTLDGTLLSTDYAGGFTGAVIGLYASSANE
jgi:alpha-N-arabinofuranosidase